MYTTAGRNRLPSDGSSDQHLTNRISHLDLAWRTAYRIGFPLARLWWTLVGTRHDGALVAIHVGADLLLLRSSYRREWNFPGGGIKRGERPEEAARRELVEELGLRAETLKPAGDVVGRWEGRFGRVYLFELRLDRLPDLVLDNREIVGAQLVSPEALRGATLTGPVAAYVNANVARA